MKIEKLAGGIWEEANEQVNKEKEEAEEEDSVFWEE